MVIIVMGVEMVVLRVFFELMGLFLLNITGRMAISNSCLHSLLPSSPYTMTPVEIVGIFADLFVRS
jgi:hypothetical protein